MEKMVFGVTLRKIQALLFKNIIKLNYMLKKMVNKIFYWMAAIFIVVILALIILTFTNFKPGITEAKCGIENCHGMDLDCGPNVPEACTAMYMLGDKCRQYAWCENVEGQCSLVENKTFETCKSCVNKCSQDNSNDPVAVFQCESSC